LIPKTIRSKKVTIGYSLAPVKLNRLDEPAPMIAKHFTKDDLIKHWPK
jgi:hypothetical protein